MARPAWRIGAVASELCVPAFRLVCRFGASSGRHQRTSDAGSYSYRRRDTVAGSNKGKCLTCCRVTRYAPTTLTRLTRRRCAASRGLAEALSRGRIPSPRVPSLRSFRVVMAFHPFERRMTPGPSDWKGRRRSAPSARQRAMYDGPACGRASETGCNGVRLLLQVIRASMSQVVFATRVDTFARNHRP